MATYLCTLPGKHGDILWALPTLRALAQAGHEVDLVLSQKYRSLQDLIKIGCPYIRSVCVDPAWWPEEGARMEPHEPPAFQTLPISTEAKSRILNLGYLGWPQEPLPYSTYHLAESLVGTLPPLDLETPWITVVPWASTWSLAGERHGLTYVFGFTDEHFELKYGLTKLLDQQLADGEYGVLVSSSGRWANEGHFPGNDWTATAKWIAGCRVFFGDCSALHVLACALGKSVVLMEPSEARWNDIFYPYGKTGRVHLVCGNDGRPTFDARHVAEALRAAAR